MRFIHSLVITTSFCTAVTACATSNDPSSGGFFGGVGGLMSGNYDRAVSDKERQLEDAKDQNIALARSSDRRTAELTATQLEFEKSETRLAALNLDITGLNKQLSQANSSSPSNVAKAADLQSKLSKLDAEVQRESLSMDDAAKQARIAELERRKEEISKAITELLSKS